MPLYQTGPNTWSNRPPGQPAAKSHLPMPMVISDTMPETEQVDGKFYTSKAAFRAVGRSLGLTEVGNEKPKPRKRVDDKEGRRQSIKKAVEQYQSGVRTRRPHR